ncbi:DUF1298 domain-containing protein [Cryobacterium cheniae]|uniref:diacylglycerol O-acyltransferase n=1 Tax=Cryobacterium cheniae TaxID=1259262 RepID=A0A4R8XI29_9MICO|nr:DUF1298 domain-containing protein [Cryobacterium cheniae]
MGVSSSIDRVSTDDLMSLATEHGASPLQVGAVLMIDTVDVLGSGTGLDVERAVDLLAQRLPGVPRLRQRLVPAPFGCGRPIWVDDADFDVTEHVSVIPCPSPGDEQAVLDLAAVLLVNPLPRTRALWAATLVTGVARHQAALIVVFHHVLADGVAGLAVLGGLVDQSDATGKPRAVGSKTRESDFPRPQASIRQLAIDAWTRRLGSLRGFPVLLRRLQDAARELRSVRWTRLRSTSLNRPTGPRRSLASVTVALDGIRNAGHAQKATVNDVVLTAIGGALHRLLALRGEAVDRFIVSVPFSERRAATHGDLGNRSGVIPIRVPGVGAAASRLRFVAEGTRKAKRSSPGATTALLGPFFRVLAQLGLFQWFVDRQRLIHTFVSNLRGPEQRLSIFGCPVTAIVPLSTSTGNVTVSFTVLSYAGDLTITLIADPDACPDLATLQDLLAEELAELAR